MRTAFVLAGPGIADFRLARFIGYQIGDWQSLALFAGRRQMLRGMFGHAEGRVYKLICVGGIQGARSLIFR